MSGDKIKNADKGKSPATSERKSLDFVRVRAKQQEKLVLDSTRRFLPGGMDEGTSRQQEKDEELRRMHQIEHRMLYEAQVKVVDRARRERYTQSQWNDLNRSANAFTKRLIEKQRRESEES